MIKKILLSILLLASLAIAQVTSYYEIKLRSATTDKLVGGKNVDLYQGAVKKYDLAESATTPGVYYHATVATGYYDIYVNGTIWKTNTFFSAKKVSAVTDNFNDSGYLANLGVDAARDSLKTRKNWVDSTLVANSAIGTNEIAPQAVTGPKIGPLSVDSSKVADNSIPKSKIPSGALDIDRRKHTWLTITSSAPLTTDSISTSISAYLFTNPKVTQIMNTGWPLKFKRITTSVVVFNVDIAGSGTVNTLVLVEEQ